MDQQTTSVATAAGNSGTQHHQDRRKVWILTGYAASFLALCGVMAYYFSFYITH
jgi:hypothetical protein